MPLHVEIVSPERVLYSGEGDMVVADVDEPTVHRGGQLAGLRQQDPHRGDPERSDVGSVAREERDVTGLGARDDHVTLARVQDALGGHDLHVERHGLSLPGAAWPWRARSPRHRR